MGQGGEEAVLTPQWQIYSLGKEEVFLPSQKSVKAKDLGTAAEVLATGQNTIGFCLALNVP